MTNLKKGQFVQVDNAIGVIVFLELENSVPEDHLGIWYGEFSDNTPKYRTVPAEYCKLVSSIKSYH